MADYTEPTASSDVSTTPEPTGSAYPSYKRWCRRIQAARKLRKDWAKKYKVEKCEEFYVGQQRTEGSEGPRVLNHFLATIRVTQPNLLFENPKFLVRPKPGKVPGVSDREASIAEGVLTAIAQQDDNLDNAASFGLLQNFFRVGVLKVVYDPTLEENPSANQPVMQRDDNNEPVADPMTGEPQSVMDPATGAPVMEPPFIVSDETYRFEWTDAMDMLFPDDGPDMKKWSWVGQEIVVPLEDAQDDERFPQELRDIFKANVTKQHEDDREKAQYDKDSDNPDDQMFRYVECYDLKKHQWCIIAEGQDFDEPLIEGALPDGIEDHPYAILPGWIPILGKDASPWPLPYVYPWLDIQEEYNIRRNQQMQGAKRSARKVFYDEGTFADPDEAVKALQSSRDMEAVKVTDVNRPPIALADTPLSATIGQDVPLLLNDYRIITGQTGAKLGNTEADTATEANFIERASQLRDVELQKAVAKWLKTAGKKMLQLIKATLTVEMFIKMRGMDDGEVQNFLMEHYGIPPQMIAMVPALKDAVIQGYGQEKLTKVTRESLQFECDVDVIPGSTKPLNLAAERAQFLEFGQLIAQAPQLALSKELLQQYAKRYDFIPQSLVEELHALAMTMMQATQTTAGHGGQNTAKENTPGGGPGESAQMKGDVAQFQQQ